MHLLLRALLIVVSVALSAEASGWDTYRANEYGFSMLIPEGTQMKTKEWAGGWGGLFGEHDGITVYGVAKLGEPESAQDIENFGVKLTGIPGEAWTEIDKGSGNGWKWYRTVQATQGAKLVFGGYGVGPKGSYLLILVTTPSDFKEHRAEYEKWYHSIRLY
jgi:hypothetical protein